MRLIEQHGHLSEHGARLGQDSDDGIALDDFQPSFQQNKQVSGLAALMQHKRAGGRLPPRPSDAMVQNRAHQQHLRFSEPRHEGCQGRTDNMRLAAQNVGMEIRPRQQ